MYQEPVADEGIQNIIDRLRHKILEKNPKLEGVALEDEMRIQAYRLLKKAEEKETSRAEADREAREQPVRANDSIQKQFVKEQDEMEENIEEDSEERFNENSIWDWQEMQAGQDWTNSWATSDTGRRSEFEPQAPRSKITTERSRSRSRSRSRERRDRDRYVTRATVGAGTGAGTDRQSVIDHQKNSQVQVVTADAKRRPYTDSQAPDDKHDRCDLEMTDSPIWVVGNNNTGRSPRHFVQPSPPDGQQQRHRQRGRRRNMSQEEGYPGEPPPGPPSQGRQRPRHDQDEASEELPAFATHSGFVDDEESSESDNEAAFGPGSRFYKRNYRRVKQPLDARPPNVERKSPTVNESPQTRPSSRLSNASASAFRRDWSAQVSSKARRSKETAHRGPDDAIIEESATSHAKTLSRQPGYGASSRTGESRSMQTTVRHHSPRRPQSALHQQSFSNHHSVTRRSPLDRQQPPANRQAPMGHRQTTDRQQPPVSSQAPAAQQDNTGPPRPVFVTRDPYASESEDDDVAPNERVVRPSTQAPRTGDASAKKYFRYKCPYKGCKHSFDDNGFVRAKDLRAHKTYEHDVCDKCRIDFLDFDSLLHHKQMSPNHIACWTCGMDFHTAPAREKHMLTEHPPMKQLNCPGCGALYHNSASFIRHITNDNCTGISIAQFRKAGMMFNKVKESVMVNGPQEAKRIEEAYRPVVDPDDEDDFPGLPGLDLRQAGPSEKRAEDKVREYQSPWKPADTANATTSLIKKLEKMSTKEMLASVDVDANQRRLLDVHRKMVGYGDRDPEPPRTPQGKILWEAVPNNQFYRPSLFQGADKRYHCPYPFCRKKCDSDLALDRHIRSPKHQNGEIRCPECFGRFYSNDSIIAHFESPSARCKIKHTELFKPAMEIASSSFLTAQYDTFGKLKVETQEPDWSK